MSADLSSNLLTTLESGPFHEALALAVRRRGLSLERLRHRLAERGVQVSTTTLSYWATGRRRPERPESLRGVGVLEEVLQLPDGTLTALLPAPKPRGRRPAEVCRDVPCLQPWHADALDRLADDLRVPDRSALRQLSVDEQVIVDDIRVERRRTVREVLRAERDQVAQTFLLWQVDDPAEGMPEITGTRSCRVGRHRWDAQTGYLALELLLDRRLMADETTIVQYELRIPGRTPLTRCGRIFSKPVHAYTLQITFSPEAVPSACNAYRQTTTDGAMEDLRELWIDPSWTVHIARTDAGPGIHGIQVDW